MPSSFLLCPLSSPALCRGNGAVLRVISRPYPSFSAFTRACLHGFYPLRFCVTQRSFRPFCVGSSSSVSTLDDLPSTLADIVKLFQSVPEPRAKYEQLLHYGRKLQPLPKEFQTPENKVHGCVSQVWVRASMNADKKVSFEAESDSLLTKGLAALLVEGLSGHSVGDILRVTPQFIQMLGLNQSLTPSRSNGFLNMLKLMQRKALELSMESEGVAIPKLERSVNHGHMRQSDEILQLTEAETFGSNEPDKPVGSGSRKERIHQKLETFLNPVVLEIEDVSYQHAGHAGVVRGATETHFNLKIVSPAFQGKTLVKRHRLVYELLQEELQGGLHALSIVAKTPEEAEH